MTPQPANMSTPDLMLELAARTVENQREHERVCCGFMRLIRCTSQFASLHQRRQVASDLRDLADELETVNTVVKHDR
jgi:hypothetical protein